MAISKFASTGLRSHLVPWPWDTGKPLVSDTLFRILQTWVILLPLTVGLISAFPIVIEFEEVYLSIGENFSAPFSFKASFVSAVSLLIAILIFKWRCPGVIVNNSKDFSSIPTNLTEELLVQQIREFVLSGLPRRLTIGERTIQRIYGRPYRLNQNIGVQGSGFRDSLESRFYPLLTKLFYECCPAWQIRMLNNFQFHCNNHQVGSSTFRLNGNENPFTNFGDPKTSDISDIKNISFQECFKDNAFMLSKPDLAQVLFGYLQPVNSSSSLSNFVNFYQQLNYSRSLSRMLFWILYLFGAVLGFIVLGDLIIRGSLIVLNS